MYFSDGGHERKQFGLIAHGLNHINADEFVTGVTHNIVAKNEHTFIKNLINLHFYEI